VRTDHRAQEQAAGLSPQILHPIAALAASGGLGALPHNGAVITLLAICGLNHKQSYFDIFMVAVASRCWRW
jgi:H+/gluconate symporter-like permease